MPTKKVKQSVVRCCECGATSNEAFLEKIKGSTEYICDNCANEVGVAISSKGNFYQDGDDDSDDDGYGGGSGGGDGYFDDYGDDGGSNSNDDY
jgi:hypothetical protein